MLNVADFLAELPIAERLALLQATGEGLRHVTAATECLAGVGPRGETVVELLTSLSTAIERLQVARGIVQRRA
jgi:hypothetical protein